MSEVRKPLPRVLTAWGLWLLMVNGMIGAGIFGVPAAAEQLAGAFSPWVYLVCALAIAPVMLCFAALGSRFSGSGGPALYVGHAFGPFAGFQAGWAFYVARVTAFAANLNLLVTSAAFLFPDAGGPTLRIALMVLACGLMIWVNVVGVQAAIRSLGLLTLLKLLPLVLMALVGAWHLDAGVFAAVTEPPGIADLGAAILLVIYAYVGFESGLVPAGEAKRPRRDIPRALFWALFASTAVYALVQVGAQSLLPDLASSERPLVDAGERLFGTTGAILVLLGIIVSVGGNLVGSMFSTPRITHQFGQDGQLPAWFGKVHPRFGTPANSVWVYGLASLALAVTGSFVWLAVLSVFTRLLIYAACIVSLPAAERQPPSGEDGLRLRGGWLVPALALLACVGLGSQVSLVSVLATAALLLVGSALFVLARHRGRS